MKFLSSVFLAAVITTLCCAAPARAAATSGLWLAAVSVNRVGENNTRTADSLFDLGVSAVQSERALITKGSSAWSYYTAGALAANWQNTAPFSGWATGTAPLGYLLGSGSVYVAPSGGTLLSYGSDPASKNLTTYFRRTFTSSDKAGLASLRLRGWYYDTITVYLNGVALDTSAMGNLNPADGSRELSVPVTNLIDGSNNIAVEVTLAGPTSPDLYFDLELTGIPVTSPDLISTNSTGWKYQSLDQSGWLTNPTDSWGTGTAPFGYGGYTVATTIASASVTHYRQTISVVTPTRYSALNLRLLRDDGAVVYLNGKEIFRSNMPTGTITYATAPEQNIGPLEGSRYVTATVPLATGDLVAGSNIFAVEVHQHPTELAAATTLGALTPTGAGFPLRLLLHVDAAGSVSLLKEAIFMKDSTGNAVVVADSALASGYAGAALRGGTSVGLRTSAIGYDFNSATIACTGALGTSGSAECSFSLLSGAATNPFLHRFHPDHDNLDERFTTALTGAAAEAYQLDRKFKLTFSSRYPANPDEPERSTASRPVGWGTSLLGGTFSETINGLHKDTLSVGGWFTMKRVSTTADLRK